jgi:predicted DNA-binding mobile mystery protein A
MKRLKLIQISERFKSIKAIPEHIRTLGTWFEQIKYIREALGLTQKQLALRVGSTQQRIGKLEKNEVSPTIDTLQKTADALNCELLVSFIPRKEIEQAVKDRAEAKADDIVSQSVANSAMESQKPSERVVALSKESLIVDLIENKRTLLW